MKYVMLDIRVLGKSPDSPIFAIECAFFEPSTGKIGPGYYRAVDIRTVGGIYPEAVLQLMKGDSVRGRSDQQLRAPRSMPLRALVVLSLQQLQSMRSYFVGRRVIRLVLQRWHMLFPGMI